MNTTGTAMRGNQSGTARTGHFLKHLVEMTLAMMVGMMAGAVVLVLLFGTVLASEVEGLTTDEIGGRYPVLICLVIALSMVIPMAAWMRHRGMAWRPVAEMATAMLVPLGPIFALLGIGVIAGASACGVYCAAMIPAMVAAMLFRLDLYTAGHTRHVGHPGVL